MVARRVDAARTTTDKMRENSDRIDDLARANGRPTTQMRNKVGHVLDLQPASALPMLIPKVAGDDTADASLDSALRFADGALSVRNPTDTAFRDFQARTINASGSIGTQGNLVAQGDVNVVGNAYSANNICFGNSSADRYHATDRIDADGYLYAGIDINAGRSIGAVLNVFAGGTVNDGQGNVRIAPACERRLKNHIRDLDDPLAVVEQWRPAVATWADDTIRAQRGDDPFAAVYVDEVADTAPEAVYDRGDGTRTTDDRALIAYLTGAVQQLAGQNRDLLARVAVLEGQVGR